MTEVGDKMKYILNTSYGTLHINGMCGYPIKYKEEFDSEIEAVKYQIKCKRSIYHCSRCYKKLDEIVSDYLSKNK